MNIYDFIGFISYCPTIANGQEGLYFWLLSESQAFVKSVASVLILWCLCLKPDWGHSDLPVDGQMHVFFSWPSDGVKCKQIGVQDLLKWMTKVDQKIDKKWKRTTNPGGKADIVLFKIAKQDLFICMGQPRKIEG